MVVSRTAKQSRTSDTTVCYIHGQSVLIEHLLKACYSAAQYTDYLVIPQYWFSIPSHF